MTLKEVVVCLVLTMTGASASLPCPCDVITFNQSDDITAQCRNNDLTEIPSCVPNGTTRFDFSGNILQDLTAGFTAHMPALHDLIASRSHVTNVSADAFSRTPQLRELRLAHNSIHDLPHDVFDATPLLEVVDLTSNMLGSLPAGLFKRTPKLVRLELTSNYLSTLPGDLLSGCGEQAILRLGTNGLTTLPAPLINTCHSLLELDVSSNKMTVLPVEVVAAIANLSDLHSLVLDNNLWHCDCTLAPLVELLRMHEDLEPRLTCGSPPEKRELHVVHVVSDLDCPPLDTNPSLLATGHASLRSHAQPKSSSRGTTAFVLVGVAACVLGAAAAFFAVRHHKRKNSDTFGLLHNEDA